MRALVADLKLEFLRLDLKPPSGDELVRTFWAIIQTKARPSPVRCRAPPAAHTGQVLRPSPRTPDMPAGNQRPWPELPRSSCLRDQPWDGREGHHEATPPCWLKNGRV